MSQVVASEQALIGSILVNNDCFDDIELKPHEFQTETHRIMFEAISEFLNAGKSIDLILLAEHLQRKGTLARVGDLPYIGELVQNAVSMKTVKSHARIISGDYKFRKLAELTALLNEAIEQRQDIDKITDLAECGLIGLLDDDSDKGFAHVSQALDEDLEWEEQDEKGFSTGLRDLDRSIGGLKPSDLIILAARPSMGKTALACQIAEHVANKEHVIIFSMEMVRRQISARMRKHHESIVGQSEAVRHIKSLKLHIDDRSALTIGDIRSRCRQIKRKYGLSLIVVDYIQLMRGDGDNRTQEIGSITRGLKAIAKEFDINVIALSQLNRDVEKRIDKRPLMSDLRESGEIEQDADIILFVHREEYYDKETDLKGIAELICRKNRNGSTGDATTTFKGDTTRFGDFNGQPILRVLPQPKRRFDF